jgi:predicted kinase
VKRKLILIAGYAGAGKSMVGKIMATKLSAPLIDKDTVVLPLINKTLELINNNAHDRESALYTDVLRPLEYEATMNVAWENLQCNPVVVVVAPFVAQIQDPVWLAQLEKRSRKMNTEYHFVWVRSSKEAIRKLLIARNTPRDTWKLENWDEYSSTLPVEPPVELPNEYFITNDARDLHAVETDIDTLLKTIGLENKLRKSA